jgi:hypothetical protein
MMKRTETVAGVAQGVTAGDRAIYIPVHPISEGEMMSNYRVKLIVEGGKDDGKTKSFYVNAPSVSDAVDEAERQAKQQDPSVTGVYVDEVD